MRSTSLGEFRRRRQVGVSRGYRTCSCVTGRGHPYTCTTTRPDGLLTSRQATTRRPLRWGGELMKINHRVIVFDAADLKTESAFWAHILHGTVDAEDDWHMVEVDGAPHIGVQLAPDHAPPE